MLIEIIACRIKLILTTNTSVGKNIHLVAKSKEN